MARHAVSEYYYLLSYLSTRRHVSMRCNADEVTDGKPDKHDAAQEARAPAATVLRGAFHFVAGDTTS